jgi:tetratricopeptide (TPR) repeat protein
LSETPTPYRFEPGDPTATPPGEDIADPDYQSGQEAFLEGDFEAVLGKMAAVLERDDRLAAPHWYRGMAFYQLGDCESGLAEMEIALEIDRGYALAWADRGLMRACLGQENGAISDYRRALSIDPSLAKVHERLGAHAFAMGEYEGALEQYERAVAIDASLASSWWGRGTALQNLLRFDECIESANRAAEVDREFWPALRLRGECTLGNGDFEGAIPDLERYLQQEPGDADTWYNLGVLYRKTGRLEKAIDAYNRVLGIDSTYVEAWINRGSIFIDQGLFDEAVSDYSRALGVAEIPAAYNGRAAAYSGLGRFEEAAADLERSIELMPVSVYPYCQVVQVYFNLGRFHDAIRAAQDAARVSPECAKDQRILELQARSYYALGLYDQAVEYIDRALEQGTFALAFYYRGIAQDDAGHWHEAMMDLETFVQLAGLQDFGDAERSDAEVRLVRLRATTPSPLATPEGLAEAETVSLEGAGPFVISPGETVTWKITPPSSMTVQLVGNLSLYFIDVTAEGNGAADIAFQVWDRDYNEWSDGQGHYHMGAGSSGFGVMNPTRAVSLPGEFWIQILNRGSSPVTVGRFQASMNVLTTDGRNLEVGGLPPQE